jgi:hypothetical protein
VSRGPSEKRRRSNDRTYRENGREEAQTRARTGKSTFSLSSHSALPATGLISSRRPPPGPRRAREIAAIRGTVARAPPVFPVEQGRGGRGGARDRNARGERQRGKKPAEAPARLPRSGPSRGAEAIRRRGRLTLGGAPGAPIRAASCLFRSRTTGLGVLGCPALPCPPRPSPARPAVQTELCLLYHFRM